MKTYGLLSFIWHLGLWTGFQTWRFDRRVRKNPAALLGLAQACLEASRLEGNLEQREAWLYAGRAMMSTHRQYAKGHASPQ